PFSMRELLARVKVLFRRAALDAAPKRADAEAPLRIGDLELDLQRYTVKWKGQPVSLTVTEFMMLHALVRHPGHVKSRTQLHQDGYPLDDRAGQDSGRGHRARRGAESDRRRRAAGAHAQRRPLPRSRPERPRDRR